MLALRPLPTKVKQAALSGEALPAEARGPQVDTILERWERCRSLGVDPDGRAALEEAIVTAPRLAAARKRTEELQRSASSVLDGFAAACARSDFISVLTDASGIAVKTFGGGAFAPEARRLRLIDGAYWGEGVRGTNAIGTALAESRPVAVHGAAHYARVNEGVVCFAAPIVDPLGRTVGVLDATSFAERANAFDPGVVMTVARAVEEVLRARAYAGAAGGIALVERMMERAAGAAFLVERPRPGSRHGRIVRANRAARALVDAPHDSTLAEAQALSPSDFVPPWAELVKMAGVNEPQTLSHAQRDLDVIVEPVHGEGGEILAALAFVREQPRSVRHTSVLVPTSSFEPILGSDRNLVRAKERCEKLSRSKLPVLLLAETGTGKELFARAVHSSSARSDGPYIAVNCGAIQPELLLTELFGHGPGAFTGGTRHGRDGFVAAADGGTLFLDEVADLSADAQVALLRVLEDGSYQRVGETEERVVDLRIVAATSRDLRERVAAGSFRDDLFFRIGGACVELPPLRRRDDLAELIDVFWGRTRTPGGEAPPELTEEAHACLMAHHWPGNVRELESALGFAAVMAEGDELTRVEHLPGEIACAQSLHTEKTRRETSLDSARREALVQALERSGGNVSQAARELGVARSTVYRLAKRLGLS